MRDDDLESEETFDSPYWPDPDAPSESTGDDDVAFGTYKPRHAFEDDGHGRCERIIPMVCGRTLDEHELTVSGVAPTIKVVYEGEDGA